jgi:hypothetical protein
MSVPAMTKGERQDLQRLVRQRAKLEKAGVAQRRAELWADFEAQLQAEYAFDQDEVWKAAHELAEEVLADANKKVAERSAELGIPKRFAPRLVMGWHRGGTPMVGKHRNELRKLATSKLDAMEKAAKTEIERASVDAQTALVAEGLTTEKASGFLESLPSTGSLMPQLDLAEVRGLLANGRKAQ